MDMDMGMVCIGSGRGWRGGGRLVWVSVWACYVYVWDVHGVGEEYVDGIYMYMGCMWRGIRACIGIWEGMYMERDMYMYMVMHIDIDMYMGDGYGYVYGGW